jgi:hypothetical protein
VSAPLDGSDHRACPFVRDDVDGKPTPFGSPGPELSRLAALRAFRRDPIGLLTHAASFGDVSYLNLPRFPAYLLNHPDLVHEVLVTGNQRFMKGPDDASGQARAGGEPAD